MTTKTHRPGLGLALLTTAFFLMLSPQCGLLGRGLSHILHVLIGGAGTGLLTVALLLGGTLYVMPSGTLGRLVQMLRARRAKPAIVVTPRLKSVPAAVPPTPPVPRLATPLMEATTGLKHLGYSKAEIDAVVPKLDQRKGTEGMIRDALKLLRRAA